MVFIMSDTNNNDSIDLNEESAIVNDTLGNINCLGALEALLFAVGEAVEINKLADSIGVKPKDVENAYEELNKRYDSDDYGIRIIKLDDKLQLCTKNMYYDKLINLVNIPKKYILTDVLLETLSIVAYKQPVTRTQVEEVRGVNCSTSISRLVEYGLIFETGRLDAPGRPFLYATTDEFLRRFDLGSLDDLPDVSEDLLGQMKLELETEEEPESCQVQGD